MDRKSFMLLKAHASGFVYSSFAYIVFDSVKNYRIIADSDDICAIRGYDATQALEEVIWAANEAEPLLRLLDGESNILIGFIPRRFKRRLAEEGYAEYGVLREYWNSSISENAADGQLRSASFEQAKEISDLTKNCLDESREFKGETPEMVKEWIMTEEPNLLAAKSEESAVLFCQVGEIICGAVFVAIYASKARKAKIVWVRELAVLKQFQHQGFGRRLLKGALAYGVSHQATIGFLMADDLNANAIGLYTSEGFSPNPASEQIDMIRLPRKNSGI